MASPSTILVGHREAEPLHLIEAAFHDAGYEVLRAQTPEAVLRSAVGTNPRLVVVEAAMPDVGGFELHARLGRTGLAVPPIMVLVAAGEPSPPGPVPRSVYVVTGEDTAPERLVTIARLVLLAREVDGEFAATLDVLHGDLTRTSFGDLIQALRQHVVTGTLRFSSISRSGIALQDGVVVDAWRGSVRGVKAFNRLAGLPKGGFSLTPGEVDVERSITEDPGSLVLAAVDDRVAFHEALSRLPSLDAKPEVNLTPEFFNQQFSPTERKVLARAQEAANLGQLLDLVETSDAEVAAAVVSLRDQDLLRLQEPAGRIHVVTDSTADLLAPDARRHGIEVAAVSIVFGTAVFKDGIDLTPEEFQKRLKTSPDAPTTHPASQGEFLEMFRRLVPTGDVLAVLCASGVSKSHGNARAAVEAGQDELRELRRSAGASSEPRVVVVDSLQCSGSLGMMALFAKRMLDDGIGLDEAARRLETIGQRWHTLLMLHSLDNLGRGLGVSGAGGGTGRQADTRWLVALDKGKLEVLESVDHQLAREALIDRVVAGLDPTRPVFASLVHASAPAELVWLRQLLRSRLDIVELGEHQMGPAVMCNTGLGTVGVAVLQPTDDELETLRPR
jgi:DegV family protein with EDD domain